MLSGSLEGCSEDFNNIDHRNCDSATSNHDNYEAEENSKDSEKVERDNAFLMLEDGSGFEDGRKTSNCEPRVMKIDPHFSAIYIKGKENSTSEISDIVSVSIMKFDQGDNICNSDINSSQKSAVKYREGASVSPQEDKFGHRLSLLGKQSDTPQEGESSKTQVRERTAVLSELDSFDKIGDNWHSNNDSQPIAYLERGEIPNFRTIEDIRGKEYADTCLFTSELDREAAVSTPSDDMESE